MLISNFKFFSYNKKIFTVQEIRREAQQVRRGDSAAIGRLSGDSAAGSSCQAEAPLYIDELGQKIDPRRIIFITLFAICKLKLDPTVL